MSDFSPCVSVLQAKLQAWCVGMLSVVVDAYSLGAVIGKGTALRTGEADLWPDVIFVPKRSRGIVSRDAIKGAPTLCIDIIHSGFPEAERAALRQRYAGIHVLEYWQVEADTAQAALYQADAEWRYDLIPPDKAGMHFSTAIVELSFPVKWFREQPDIWRIMQAWGMIHE
ncbi:MAG: hypothetical protein ACUVRU_02105 [Anaerolineae bacterium]